MSFLLDITPADLGFRAPFNEYKPIQNEIIDFAVSEFETKDVVAVCGPTGVGKTLVAMSIAVIMARRAAFVTAFKGLQKQYVKDFKPYGMVNIEGRNNYDCAGLVNLDCRSGQSAHCQYVKGRGCTYEVEKAVAKEAGLLTTNYSYWFNVNDKAQGLQRTEKEAEELGPNPLGLLVLDEAHECSRLLADYVSCRLYEHDLKRFSYYPMNESIPEWVQWAKLSLPVLLEEIKTTEMDIILHTSSNDKKHMPKLVDVLHRLQGLATTLGKIAYIKEGDWIIDMEVGTKYGRLWKFDCIWPGMYTKQYLTCGVPKVLLMSATLKEKNLYDLGFKKGSFSFKSWRRIFPANRHPIYQMTAKKENGFGIKVDRKMTDDDLDRLVNKIDEIIESRLDRKGIIQSVSYALQRDIMSRSKFANIMIGNTGEPDSDTAQEAADEFRRSKPPSILISPSFSTGWDFPGPLCEFVILPKVPFIPAVSKIIKARLKRDPNYVNHLAMQTIEQAIGRGMRFEQDRCECVLLDGHFSWFLFKYKTLAQDWFVPSVRQVHALPKPPQRLIDEKKK